MRPGRSHGFVLLLALTALAVLGTALASLALRVHTRQQAAVSALAQLQRQIAIDSADTAVASQVDRLSRGPAGVVAGDAVLGGHRVQLRWANENAKANLNVLRDALGKEVFSRELDRFVAAGGGGLLDLDAGNAYAAFGLTASGAQADWPAYASFDQLADRVEVREELRNNRSELGPFDRLTLWGTGKINPRQADPRALGFALRVHLPPREADAVAEVLAGQPAADRRGLREALAELIEDWDNPGLLEGLEAHLTDQAPTTSLRVVIDNGRREDVVFRLRNASADGRGGDYELRW